MSEPWGRQLEVGCTRLAGWGRWGWYGRFSQEHREPVPSRQTEAPESWGSSSPSPKVPEPTAPVSQPRQSSNPASVPCLFALPRPPPRGGGPLLIPSRFSAHVFLRHLLSWHPGAQLGAHNKQPQGGEGGDGVGSKGWEVPQRVAWCPRKVETGRQQVLVWPPHGLPFTTTRLDFLWDYPVPLSPVDNVESTPSLRH